MMLLLNGIGVLPVDMDLLQKLQRRRLDMRFIFAVREIFRRLRLKADIKKRVVDEDL